MNKILFFAFFIFILNIVGGLYICSLGGVDLAISSGLLGNLAAFILFISIGIFLPLFFWMLPDIFYINKDHHKK
ncbi:hypothetical protein [Yersinia enterocolitica]|uniref:hypothetical protein n=1 Tax=Yersinia enterocolitica TaxID=630 RepID=UPI000326B0A4|nr:hypothetical protein [Yersinia enterocolitica]AJJ24187.1 putative membrane protein [Yersinia enterocolitica]HDL8281133.1 hypothetical protein [Yersinia enterocolitica]